MVSINIDTKMNLQIGLKIALFFKLEHFKAIVPTKILQWAIFAVLQ